MLRCNSETQGTFRSEQRDISPYLRGHFRSRPRSLMPNSVTRGSTDPSTAVSARYRILAIPRGPLGARPCAVRPLAFPNRAMARRGISAHPRSQNDHAADLSAADPRSTDRSASPDSTAAWRRRPASAAHLHHQRGDSGAVVVDSSGNVGLRCVRGF
jgi:hypothetical protein